MLAKQSYDFSNEIFSGMLRPSGKPFTCHTVGVASILVAEEASLDLILAASIHTAYSHGQLSTKSASSRQRLVFERVGEEVEFIVRNFYAVPWTPATINDFEDKFDDLNEFQKSILTLRLANEPEDHLDLSINYGQRFKSYGRFGKTYRTQRRLMVKLGLDKMAEDFVRAVQESEQAKVPNALVNKASSSFLVRALPRQGSS